MCNLHRALRSDSGLIEKEWGPENEMGLFGGAPEDAELPGSPEPSWLTAPVPSPSLEWISISLPEGSCPAR